MKPSAIRNIFTLVLLLFFVVQNVFAENNFPGATGGGQAGESEEEKYKDRYNFAVERKSPLVKLIQTNPTIKSRYDQCLKHFKEDINKDVAGCIWDGNQGPDGGPSNMKPLSDAEKEEIQKQLYDESKEEKTADKGKDEEGEGDSELDNLMNKSLSNIRRTRDPALQKLHDYLLKRLEEALYGEIQGDARKEHKVVDHAVFVNLYRSQIGKNLILAFTSYCMEACPARIEYTCPICTQLRIPEYYTFKKMEVRQKIQNCHMQNLKNVAQKPKSQKKKQGKELTQASAPAAAEAFTSCIVNLKNTCYQNDSTAPGGEYSKTRACLVTKYVRTSRKNLLVLAQLEKKLKKLDESEEGRGIRIQGAQTADNLASQDKTVIMGKEMKQYQEGAADDEKSVDDLTSITSKEMIEDGGYKKGTEEMLQELKKCKDNPSAPGCEKFVVSGDEAKETQKKIEEYSLRRNAMRDKIKAKLEKKKGGELKEYMSKYLKKMGYNEASLAKLTDQQWQSLKDEIVRRYDAETKAMVKATKEDLEKRTAKKAGQKGPGGRKVTKKEAEESLKGKLEDVRKELKQQVVKWQKMIFFNNMVSSFLVASGEDKKDSQNVASRIREFRDIESMKDEKTSGQASGKPGEDDYKVDSGISKKDLEKFRKTYEKSDIVVSGETSDKKKIETADSVVLQPETITQQIIKYDEIDTTATPSKQKQR